MRTGSMKKIPRDKFEETDISRFLTNEIHTTVMFRNEMLLAFKVYFTLLEKKVIM